MKYILHGYEPAAFFRHFEEISAIPRSSGQEKAVSDFLVGFAKERGLPVQQDAIWNVIIKKPGSQGCEGLPPVMLQGHLDMVCEQDAGGCHDFSSQGLELVEKNGQLRAKGTTLGADNGVAVALMMALLEDGSLRHPPLECVFTVQEETGLVGAAQLDTAGLCARTLINLDTEDEGVATVSCAGGARIHLRAPCRRVAAPGAGALKIALTGLYGGHSGADIHLERGNANVLMGRLLDAACQENRLFLASLAGGNKDNAIPRECTAVVVAEDGGALEAAEGLLRQAAQALCAECGEAEPGLHISLERTTAPSYMDDAATDAALALLLLAPNGVLARHAQGDGFVVSSSNLGVVRAEGEEMEFVFAPRSSQASLQRRTVRQLEKLAELLGFSVEVVSSYPGWPYAAHSPIREVFCRCYRELFGQELQCEAIHAGLECGLLCGKMPGLDAIAVGPQVDDCHTPRERLSLRSCERTYRLIARVLESMAGQET